MEENVLIYRMTKTINRSKENIS